MGEKEECKSVYKKQCRRVPMETCLDIPHLKCKTEPKEHCQNLHRLFCLDNPDQDCHTLPRRKCVLEPTVENKEVSVTECSTKLRSVCLPIISQDCHGNEYNLDFCQDDEAEEVCEEVPQEVTNYVDEEQCSDFGSLKCQPYYSDECTEVVEQVPRIVKKTVCEQEYKEVCDPAPNYESIPDDEPLHRPVDVPSEDPLNVIEELFEETFDEDLSSKVFTIDLDRFNDEETNDHDSVSNDGSENEN